MDETSQWNACTGYVTRDIVFDQPTDNTMNFFLYATRFSKFGIKLIKTNKYV